MDNTVKEQAAIFTVYTWLVVISELVFSGEAESDGAEDIILAQHEMASAWIFSPPNSNLSGGIA